MDQFTKNLTGGLRRFAMAGVGAVSLTIEKSKEIIDHLAAHGEAAAADKQAVCDELQKKMTEQLNAFTQKLKADYESASFEQLFQKCIRLTPEQKSQLIERLTAEPEPEDAPLGNDACTEASCSEAQEEMPAEAESPENPVEETAEAAPQEETSPDSPAEPNAAPEVSETESIGH